MLLLTEGVERVGFAGLLDELDGQADRVRLAAAPAEAAGTLAPVGVSRGARDARTRAEVAAFAAWIADERQRVAS